MGRAQWRLFGIGMTAVFLSALLMPIDATIGGVCMGLSMAFLFGGTLGWEAVSAIRNAGIRRRGTPMTGIVRHCRASGLVDYVPNYELEAELPNGIMTRLMVQSYGTYRPGQQIALLVDARRPGHAVLQETNRHRDF